MEDVRNRLDAYSWWMANGPPARWTRPHGPIDIGSTSEDSNFFYFTYTDFLNPTTLFQAEGVSKPSVLKALPAFFDASPTRCTQQFTESADGTRVPYFIVARKDLERMAKTPH